MAQTQRRRTVVVVIVLVLIAAVLLLLTRCQCARKAASVPPAQPAPATPQQPSPSNGVPTPQPADELLTPATVTAPGNVGAGSAFVVAWTGPNNDGDFITIVARAAPDAAHGSYEETRHGPSLELKAPVEPGAYEVRYVTGRSRKVLGRADVEVTPVTAEVQAPTEVVLGAAFQATWMGPANKGDFITVVPKDAPDDQFASYVDVEKGSPVTLTAPTEPGDVEVRYVTGLGRRVLARQSVRVTEPVVSITAPGEAVAGTTIDVEWTGPNNRGDYLTVVSAETPDGQYANYTETSKGSPLKLLMPIMDGGAELRYMTGQGRKVLARRPIRIVAAKVTLAAPNEAKAGEPVIVEWTGPNNPGDYITVVPASMPDGQYRAYTLTTKGSPLTVPAPKETGNAEVRYMTGQGNKVLAKVTIKIVE